MQNNPKRILFPITNIAFAIRQLNWAKAIESETSWDPIIFSVVNEKDLKKICDEKKIQCSCPIIYSTPDKGGRLIDILNFIIYNLSKIPFSNFISLPFTIYRHILIFKTKISQARMFMKTHHINVMMLPDSSPVYSAPILSFAARKEKVLVLTNPLDRDSPKGYAMIYKTDVTLGAKCWSVGWVTSRVFSKWLKVYSNTRILRIPPPEIFAHELLGIASPKPWNTFGFIEDFVIVGNEIQKIFYHKTGIKNEKIIVIGTPEQDNLSSLLKNYSEYEKVTHSEISFNNNKPIILCALPQAHWVSGRPEAEFQNHEEMINAWVKSLTSQNNYNIIFSLHPSMPFSNFKHLESSSIKVAQKDIVNFIPICSIFVACLSSTIPLAIALGKPVINYDVYRYSFEIEEYLYKEAFGTVTVHNQIDFNSIIKRITTDIGYYNTMKKKQNEISKKWGVIDGQSSNRLNNFLNSILNLN